MILLRYFLFGFGFFVAVRLLDKPVGKFCDWLQDKIGMKATTVLLIIFDVIIIYRLSLFLI